MIKSKNRTATESNRHSITATFTAEQWASLEKQASSVGMDVLELIQCSLDHMDEFIAKHEREIEETMH
jgi:hypothetical protein